MKITTWNVNGIRRFPDGKVKKMLEDMDSEIFCIQETKLPRDAITADISMIDGYNSYFSFCYSGRKGYSGVATFCKDTCKPYCVRDHLSASGAEKPLGDVEVDGEGRAVITEFYLKNMDSAMVDQDAEASTSSRCKLAVINLYCVNYVPDNRVRFDFKMRHHLLLEARVDWYRSNGYHVIFLGDLNIAHKRIDHCEAHLMLDFDVQPHRLWLTNLLAKGYYDCFRYFHPTEEKAYTVWNQKTGARTTNYGTRIDYFIANKELFEMNVFLNCYHLTDYYGSDHCPVVLEFKENWVLESAQELSPLCTKFLPEFRGTQTSIRSFFTSSTTNLSPKSITIKKKPRVAKQSSLNAFFKKQGTKKAVLDEVLIPEEEVGFYHESSASVGMCPEASDSIKMSQTSAAPARSFLSNKNRPLFKCNHGELAVEKIVKKKGPNYNRRFYTCARPQGFAGDKNANCNYFHWASE